MHVNGNATATPYVQILSHHLKHPLGKQTSYLHGQITEILQRQPLQFESMCDGWKSAKETEKQKKH